MTFHSSNSLFGTLVAACLFASACGANPDDSGDAVGGASGSGAAGALVAGASGSGKGLAGSGSGNGGAFGSAGSFGTSGGAAGSFGSGGSAVGGTAGFGGSRSAAGGAGLGGFGGASGQGAGGHAHGGAGGGSGGTTTATVTFTQLYTQFFHNSQFVSNCVGYGCHVPANHGIDFSTQASGYSTVKANLSRVVSDISEGYMPRGRTQWPEADVALLKAWQAEGAPNN